MVWRSRDRCVKRGELTLSVFTLTACHSMSFVWCRWMCEHYGVTLPLPPNFASPPARFCSGSGACRGCVLACTSFIHRTTPWLFLHYDSGTTADALLYGHLRVATQNEPLKELLVGLPELTIFYEHVRSLHFAEVRREACEGVVFVAVAVWCGVSSPRLT